MLFRLGPKTMAALSANTAVMAAQAQLGGAVGLGADVDVQVGERRAGVHREGRRSFQTDGGFPQRNAGIGQGVVRHVALRIRRWSATREVRKPPTTARRRRKTAESSWSSQVLQIFLLVTAQPTRTGFRTDIRAVHGFLSTRDEEGFSCLERKPGFGFRVSGRNCNEPLRCSRIPQWLLKISSAHAPLENNKKRGGVSFGGNAASNKSGMAAM